MIKEDPIVCQAFYAAKGKEFLDALPSSEIELTFMAWDYFQLRMWMAETDSTKIDREAFDLWLSRKWLQPMKANLSPMALEILSNPITLRQLNATIENGGRTRFIFGGKQWKVKTSCLSPAVIDEWYTIGTKLWLQPKTHQLLTPYLLLRDIPLYKCCRLWPNQTNEFDDTVNHVCIPVPSENVGSIKIILLEEQNGRWKNRGRKLLYDDVKVDFITL